MKKDDDRRYSWTTIIPSGTIFDLVLIGVNLVLVIIGIKERKEEDNQKQKELLIWAKTLEKKKEKNGKS